MLRSSAADAAARASRPARLSAREGGRAGRVAARDQVRGPHAHLCRRAGGAHALTVDVASERSLLGYPGLSEAKERGEVRRYQTISGVCGTKSNKSQRSRTKSSTRSRSCLNLDWSSRTKSLQLAPAARRLRPFAGVDGSTWTLAAPPSLRTTSMGHTEPSRRRRPRGRRRPSRLRARVALRRTRKRSRRPRCRAGCSKALAPRSTRRTTSMWG